MVTGNTASPNERRLPSSAQVALELEQTIALSESRPRKRSSACRRCHRRKVRCSGGNPCNACRRSNRSEECIYDSNKPPSTKVRARRVERHASPNDRTTGTFSNGNDYTRDDPNDLGTLGSQSAAHLISSPEQLVSPERLAPAEPLATNPAGTRAPWFVDMHVPDTPILVAESSDSAFATRLRQVSSNVQQSHFPRVDYVSDETLLHFSDAGCAWPNPPRARFLLETTLKRLGSCYHVLLRSTVTAELEQYIQDPNSISLLARSRLWAAFAVGALYATRVSGETFPGLHYFAQATKILYTIPERPLIGMVEIRLLLSFYSLCLNRRHSAYVLAGSAVRLAIVMGLHLNVPPSLLPDPVAREHRICVWWTAYTFDHALKVSRASKLNSDPKACALQLLFNQLVILATRPILLHVLRRKLADAQAEADIPESALVLSDACVRCARHSYDLLTENWTNGSLMVFDYFDAQYLFSTATILAASVFCERIHNSADRDRLECVAEFLLQLKLNGNLAAAEFHQHLHAIMSLMQDLYTRPASSQAFQEPSGQISNAQTEPIDEQVQHNGRAAAELTLNDPFFQELLAQPTVDLQFIDQASFGDFNPSFYN
ncbi:hypothetical protein KC318_g585 [Hortaea werneckii]|nr:hypothetical protein KC334_g786 [Hortaea werneckii]KAI7027437.1 hypothetical protein KC355_g332 [Hortaea werneckii]KAI7675967.1 hypothetical protein KC318_g585 [Hortaea werneckii]